MYVDNQLSFSKAQSMTVSAAAFLYSTGWIDLGLAGREIGVGVPLYIVVNVSTVFACVGAGRLDIALLSDATDAASDSGSTVHATIGSFDITTVTPLAGAQLVMPFPQMTGHDSGELLQYVSLRYGAITNDITTGNVDAFITDVPQAYKSYADGFTIS